MIRATTGGVLRSYRANLMSSFNSQNKARDTVLTQRNFNSYAEDPASAAKAFRLRKSRMTVQSQYNICKDTYFKYQQAFSSLLGVDEMLDTENGSQLNTLKATTLEMLNTPTGDAREQLNKVLDQISEALVQNFNQKYGENFIFAGADGHNVPFEIKTEADGIKKLYYRGVPVDATEPKLMMDGGTPPAFLQVNGEYVLADATMLPVVKDNDGMPDEVKRANDGKPFYVKANAVPETSAPTNPGHYVAVEGRQWYDASALVAKIDFVMNPASGEPVEVARTNDKTPFYVRAGATPETTAPANQTGYVAVDGKAGTEWYKASDLVNKTKYDTDTADVVIDDTSGKPAEVVIGANTFYVKNGSTPATTAPAGPDDVEVEGKKWYKDSELVVKSDYEAYVNSVAMEGNPSKPTVVKRDSDKKPFYVNATANPATTAPLDPDYVQADSGGWYKKSDLVKSDVYDENVDNVIMDGNTPSKPAEVKIGTDTFYVRVGSAAPETTAPTDPAYVEVEGNKWYKAADLVDKTEYDTYVASFKDSTGNLVEVQGANGGPSFYVKANATPVVEVVGKEWYKESDLVDKTEYDTNISNVVMDGATGDRGTVRVNGDDYYVVKGGTMTVENYNKALKDVEKLEYLKDEKLYVDIGLGFQENEKGELIPSSAFNAALIGINFFGYGMDDEGDPKNLFSLVQRMKDISESVAPGENWDSVWPEFNRLVGKFEDASSNFKTAFNNMDAGTTKLQNNVSQLEDSYYNLQEQYGELEDVDMADAITSFIWAQYCYNAALKVGNSILSESLMDYLS